METDRAATANQVPAAPQRWLVTVTQLPTDNPAARMRMLRTLESLGAAVMREGVYLLPDTPETRRALERQAQFKRFFDRSARYDELTKTIESLRVGFGVTDASVIARVLHKQRRDFEAI